MQTKPLPPASRGYQLLTGTAARGWRGRFRSHDVSRPCPRRWTSQQLAVPASCQAPPAPAPAAPAPRPAAAPPPWGCWPWLRSRPRPAPPAADRSPAEPPSTSREAPGCAPRGRPGRGRPGSGSCSALSEPGRGAGFPRKEIPPSAGALRGAPQCRGTVVGHRAALRCPGRSPRMSADVLPREMGSSPCLDLQTSGRYRITDAPSRERRGCPEVPHSGGELCSESEC